LIINPFINNQINNSTQSVGLSGEVTQTKLDNGQQVINNLSSGDTIAGQIVSKDGNVVSVSLGNNSLITALLDSKVDLPVGSNISFSVKASDAGNITLTPLMTNMSSSSPVVTALNAAGLIGNEKNVAIIESMMKEGMSIGKDEVLNLVKGLDSFSVNEVADGVMLAKLGIEPTVDNLNQFQAYLGYEHQVSSAINDMMELVPDTIAQMVSEGNGSNALSFAGDILNILTNQGAMYPMDDNTLVLSNMEIPVNAVLDQMELGELTGMLESSGLPTELSADIMNGNVSLQELLLVIKDSIDVNAEGSEQLIDGKQSLNTDADKLNPENWGVDKQSNNRIDIGKDFLAALNKVNEDAFKDDQLQSKGELLQSKAFAKLIKNAALNQWKLTPSQVGEDKQVSDLYKRITEQTNRLLNVMNEHAKADTPLAAQINELGKNINFMNELNNMFNYVQLPMKFADNEAHGELYVYSNKKNLGSSDGTVSALLHLDMDHLGPTDVYVTMNSANHVNTHFYLQDDAALDLIEAHIDELNARIEKRGYNCTSQVSPKEEMANIMQTIVDENKSSVPISMSAFDARA